mmetsp:Transcript_40073/g.61262  ORF Transcript_40073/g.61262 Transcript_40073/m.61262 type:complete len:95 (+) Transcript_40073:309-593(+)|eukprot:CAMPEP_0170512448 /NCGR_PEP_ID=MMETSP0208-20121228/66856_1 /TAXON_ID=197538 /ORGANISM="Strombidium inclinatum, Strain S3" /LENGTH=94 /DNA_ID=CAMNT_0010796081 /DNA_START=1311 /DNA_END=1595 /DNA_ORIENTATION=-
MSYANKEIYVDEKKILSNARILAGKSGAEGADPNGKLHLTKEEKSILQVRKQEEMNKIRDQVMNRFDSTQNWSIMIDPKNNDIRNQAMQKIKFE